MNTSITSADIDEILAELGPSDISVQTLFRKCTVVSVQLKNGFVITESSACVDPANYNQETGKNICMQRIRDRVWELEGYALQKKLYEEGRLK